MITFRRFLAVLAVGVGLTTLVLAANSSSTRFGNDIEAALRTADLNESTAESAPQQQVVNGWVARDLLAIQGRQLDQLAKGQQRENLLVGLVAILVGLAAVILVVPPSKPEVLSGEPAVPGPGVEDAAEPGGS